MSNLIAEAITKWFGPRCPIFAGDCAACKAWEQYDALLARAQTKLTPERLRTLLHYDEATGRFTRLVDQGRYAAGGRAGTVDSHEGYRRVGVDGVLYREHRLAWLYVHGEWPALEVDHINGDRADNRFVNLRLATRIDNTRNRGRGRNNTSGIKGVSRKAQNKWTATITLGGKNKYLGSFATREEAATAYASAVAKYYGAFART